MPKIAPPLSPDESTLFGGMGAIPPEVSLVNVESKH